MAKTKARKPDQGQALGPKISINEGPLTEPQRAAVAGIARAVAEDVFAEKIAAALADPDVKGSKSALGYLLGRVRRR